MPLIDPKSLLILIVLAVIIHPGLIKIKNIYKNAASKSYKKQ